MPNSFIQSRGRRLLLAVVFAGLLCTMPACSGGGPSDVKLPDLGKKDEGPLGPPFYEDVTESSGVRHSYRNGEETGYYAILESLGGGVALFDYDGDGLLDLFATGGGHYDIPETQSLKEKKIPQVLGYPCKLFKNLGNFKFKDVTAETGLERPWHYTHGAAVADYDRDGWPDLLVTGWGRLALFHNEPINPKDPAKGRRFVEVSTPAGLHDKLWSTSAAWADFDGDGWPDLYVCHYVDWAPDNNTICQGYTANVKRDVCPPKKFEGLPDVLYRNNGDGTFTDVTKEAGIRVGPPPSKKGQELGKGLGVIVADYNGDRKPDVYVANDTVINFLYWNRTTTRGAIKFEEKGMDSGVALDDNGAPQGSMGLATGDYDHSGQPSIFVTNYEGEMHALYRLTGKELFTFSTAIAGIAAIGQRYVGFGTAFVDVDNDGWQDLVIANGHVIRHPTTAGLRQKPVLLRNLGKGKFRAVTPQGGTYFQGAHQARGMAVGDLDNDGRPDLVVSRVNDNVAVLRNIANPEKRPHWLGLGLVGAKNADLVGTKVTLEAAGVKQARFVLGGGSYLSASDPRLLFGLGDQVKIDRVTVAWPSGRDQTWEGSALPTDRYWILVEGQSAPQASPRGTK